jgi:hypothetical protein
MKIWAAEGILDDAANFTTCASPLTNEAQYSSSIHAGQELVQHKLKFFHCAYEALSAPHVKYLLRSEYHARHDLGLG